MGRRALGPVALLALAGLVWLARGGGSEAPALPRPPVSEARGGGLEPGPSAGPELGPTEIPDDGAGAPGRTPAPASPTFPSPTPEASGSPRPSFVLRLELVGPDRAALAAPGARARLQGDGGSDVELGPSIENGTVIEGAIEPGNWSLVVEAEGFRHIPERLALDAQAFEEEDGRAVFRHRATLWPAGWIPVVVRTPDGRPFVALAEDAGHEPKRFYWQAFEVRTARDSFSFAAPADPEPVATFRPAPGYQVVEIAPGVAGSLQELAPRPWYAGLWVHGVFQAEQLVAPDAQEVVFELGRAALEARLARVRLRVRERDSGRPVLDARATLKADTSAHRRKDLSDVGSDEAGRIVFERVLPGEHELSVQRGDNLLQRRLTVAPGEDLDLGELVLGLEAGIPLVVVDAEGRGTRAFVEIAPYEPGADVGRLYPPNLHRTTDGQGRYVLPVPDRVSIVRARPILDPRGHAEVGTPNAILDPTRLPPEVRLVAQTPVAVRFEPRLPLGAGEELAVEDHLGLVIARVAERETEVALVPGTYRVRRGSEAATVEVIVTAETRVVRP